MHLLVIILTHNIWFWYIFSDNFSLRHFSNHMIIISVEFDLDLCLCHTPHRFNWTFAFVSMFLCELPNINHVWMVQCMKWFHKRCGVYEFCSYNLLLTHSRLSVKRFLVGWNVKSIGPWETITWQIVILFMELHPLCCTGFLFRSLS